MARQLSKGQRAIYLAELTRMAEEWLPVVRRLRPARPWAAVPSPVNAKLPPGRRWSPERLRRAAGAFRGEGASRACAAAAAPTVRGDDRLMVLVAGIARANPDLSLRAMGAQLEAMRETTPAGRAKWHVASVKSLLDRARRLGLVPVS